MILEDLLKQGKIKVHATSKEEIQDLIKAIERDVKDVSTEGLSSERKFCIAYNAILLSATILLNCKGYRTSGEAHHFNTIRTIPLILGEEYIKLSRYFDHCRYKRNLADYERVGAITNKEAKEIILEAKNFFMLVKQWVMTNSPQYILAQSTT